MKILTLLIFLLLCYVFSDYLILDETQCIGTINGECVGKMKDTKGFIPSRYIPFYEPKSTLEDLYKKNVYF